MGACHCACRPEGLRPFCLLTNPFGFVMHAGYMLLRVQVRRAPSLLSANVPVWFLMHAGRMPLRVQARRVTLCPGLP